jgi:hypothetical protein
MILRDSFIRLCSSQEFGNRLWKEDHDRDDDRGQPEDRSAQLARATVASFREVRLEKGKTDEEDGNR